MHEYTNRASWKISLTTVGNEPATFGLLVQWYFGIESSPFHICILKIDSSNANTQVNCNVIVLLWVDQPGKLKN